MNHETLTQIVRLVEKHFNSPERLENMHTSVNDSIKHIATHLPVLSPKSTVEEFAAMDALQVNLGNLDKLGNFLHDLDDVLNRTE